MYRCKRKRKVRPRLRQNIFSKMCLNSPLVIICGLVALKTSGNCKRMPGPSK
jgi:hypothetical protein